MQTDNQTVSGHGLHFISSNKKILSLERIFFIIWYWIGIRENTEYIDITFVVR